MMTHSTIREVDALVSLSRALSRHAQTYKRWSQEPYDAGSIFPDQRTRWAEEHARCRKESVKWMCNAYRQRDRYCALKEAHVFQETAE